LVTLHKNRIIKIAFNVMSFAEFQIFRFRNSNEDEKLLVETIFYLAKIGNFYLNFNRFSKVKEVLN